MPIQEPGPAPQVRAAARRGQDQARDLRGVEPRGGRRHLPERVTPRQRRRRRKSRSGRRRHAEGQDEAEEAEGLNPFNFLDAFGAATQELTRRAVFLGVASRGHFTKEDRHEDHTEQPGLAALGAALFSPPHRPASAADRIPITTSSDEARQLYLEGRDLYEKLRATDARARFEKAAAKDPAFALAQVGLANTVGNGQGVLRRRGASGRARGQGVRVGEARSSARSTPAPRASPRGRATA